MYKPYANAPILYIWRNGKRYGNAIFSMRNALKKCEEIATDIFEDPSKQIEIYNEETAEIIMYKKGSTESSQ